MKIDILTLFPDMMNSYLGESIIGRAQSENLIEINCVNIRDFSVNKHKKVDDEPFGGGTGMVMACQPIVDAWKSLGNKSFTIYFTPRGRKIDQNLIDCLSLESDLALICGHYEGVDERAIEVIVDLEVSLGDFVLTGGEIPALALVDGICRQVPNVIKSAGDESFNNGLLEHPQYTRPAEYEGLHVPAVLLNGNHAEIDKWRNEQSLDITSKRRSDLTRRRRVGVLGGTFNPIHKGHIDIAKRACEEFKLDEVVFAICNEPFHKEVNDLASTVDRLNMCLIAIENLPTFSASVVDIKRGGKTYTIDTIADLRKQYPFADFYYIVGNDVDVSSFYKYDELCKQVKFAQLERKIVVSSTEIRNNLEFTYMNSKIITYISKHNLYGAQNEKI